MHISQLVVSPAYIIILLVCIGYLIFLRKEKGFWIKIGKIYSILHVCLYLIALFFYAIGK